MKNNFDINVLSGNILPVMETFQTIQGEGYFKGTSAYFIRIGGCNVGCHWCDIKESWDYNNYNFQNVYDIVNSINSKPKIVVVTGGEPLMWNMSPLTKILNDKDFKTHLETSGAYPVTGNWDWFCLSPKKNKKPCTDSFKIANELKVIIYNKSDFEFAKQMSREVSLDCKLFLQPEWSKREKMMPYIVDFVLKNEKWRVSLQTHKYMNIP